MKDSPEKQSLGAAAREARMTRLTFGGSKGASAAIIGFVLVGPILAGFLIGAWLDKRLGTEHWTIVLGLLGVFSGFREMFVTLQRLAPKPGEKTPPPGRSGTVQGSRMAPPTTAAPPAPVEESPKPRLFSVPPPPFMEQPATQNAAPETSDELLDRLLGKHEDDESGSDSKTGNA